MMLRTKAAARAVARTLHRKREEIAALRDELEDLNDYLDLVEARLCDEGKPRLSHQEVKRRYGSR